ncbi:MAG: hypothetical protein ACREO5_06210 [Candidatus Binatia bacterium]
MFSAYTSGYSSDHDRMPSHPGLILFDPERFPDDPGRFLPYHSPFADHGAIPDDPDTARLDRRGSRRAGETNPPKPDW